MKTIYKVLLSVAVLVALDQLIGFYLDDLFWKNDCSHANGEIVHYLSNEATPDTLIIGSSRVHSMIDPSIIGRNIFSLSKPSNHFFYHVALVDILTQRNRLPKKAVIINLSVEDMFLEHGQFLLEDLHYLKYFYGKNDFLTQQLNQENPLNRLFYWPKSAKFGGNNFKLLTNYWQEVCHPVRAFIPIETSPQDAMRVQAGKNELLAKQYVQFNPMFFDMLTHLNRLCKSNGLELILFKGINLVDVTGFEKASKELKRLSRKENFTFIDFHDYRKRNDFPDSTWVDYIHLNKDGAAKYSKMIKEIL